MHTDSKRIRFGFSPTFPCLSTVCIMGRVFKVMTTVEITTKIRERMEMSCKVKFMNKLAKESTRAAQEDEGSSIRSHKWCWNVPNQPLPKHSCVSDWSFVASSSISSETFWILISNFFYKIYDISILIESMILNYFLTEQHASNRFSLISQKWRSSLNANAHIESCKCSFPVR